MLPVTLLIAIAFHSLNQRTASILIAAGVFGYGIRLMESSNLWDHLLDPVLFLTSLVGCVSALARWWFLNCRRRNDAADAS
jgi:hypothetical protein